jgi:predicted acetyltransferase
VSTIDDDYEIRLFSPTLDGDDPSPETRGWLDAEAQGFHDKRMTSTTLRTATRHQISDARQLTGVYPRARPELALPADVPVATFASLEKTMNLGHERTITAFLIASVTVRPTHRRRGILRRMMEANLRRAHDEGIALAALTASEASIYRRFGFGPSTWTEQVTVATDGRFQLTTSPTGRCELVDPAELVTIAPRVFAAFHAAQAGSVDRQSAYWPRIAGIEGEDGEEDRRIRAAVHYDESGVIDGYVSYKFTGWESRPYTIEIEDLVVTDDNAYLALWQFLASIDLVEAVSNATARVADPLRWALSDPRLVSVTGAEDYVWLRILDPVATLEARRYTSDDSIVVRILDSLRYAEGTFRIEVADGTASVTRDDAASPDLELDVSALGALYLGGADPVVLRGADRVRDLTPRASERLKVLFAPAGPVYGLTHF